jgi:uncharacterized protein
MNPLKEYVLPIQGLNKGFHRFVFEVDKSFFDCFEGSPIENGHFDLTVEMDKRDSFFELKFDFDGSIKTECDRCTAPIELFFGDTQNLLVKMSLEQHDEDADVVFISPEEPEFDLSQYVYEFICLAMPASKTFDCEEEDPRPCDFGVLELLETPPSVSDDNDEIGKPQNPFSDLKNFFNNN